MSDRSAIAAGDGTAAVRAMRGTAATPPAVQLEPLRSPQSAPFSPAMIDSRDARSRRGLILRRLALRDRMHGVKTAQPATKAPPARHGGRNRTKKAGGAAVPPAGVDAVPRRVAAIWTPLAPQSSRPAPLKSGLAEMDTVGTGHGLLSLDVAWKQATQPQGASTRKPRSCPRVVDADWKERRCTVQNGEPDFSTSPGVLTLPGDEAVSSDTANYDHDAPQVQARRPPGEPYGGLYSWDTSSTISSDDDRRRVRSKIAASIPRCALPAPVKSVLTAKERVEIAQMQKAQAERKAEAAERHRAKKLAGLSDGEARYMTFDDGGSAARASKRLRTLLRWRAAKLQSQRSATSLAERVHQEAALKRRSAARTPKSTKAVEGVTVRVKMDVDAAPHLVREASTPLLVDGATMVHPDAFIEFWSQEELQEAQAAGVGVFIVQDAKSAQFASLCRGLANRGFVRNRHHTTPIFDFKWTISDTAINYRELQQGQLVNHFEGARSVTTKAGLCRSIRRLDWVQSKAAAEVVPRTYQLSDSIDLADFERDFKICAAISIVRRVNKMLLLWKSASDRRARTQAWRTDKLKRMRLEYQRRHRHCSAMLRLCGHHGHNVEAFIGPMPCESDLPKLVALPAKPQVRLDAVKLAVRACHRLLHNDVDVVPASITEEEWRVVLEHADSLYQRDGNSAHQAALAALRDIAAGCDQVRAAAVAPTIHRHERWCLAETAIWRRLCSSPCRSATRSQFKWQRATHASCSAEIQCEERNLRAVCVAEQCRGGPAAPSRESSAEFRSTSTTDFGQLPQGPASHLADVDIAWDSVFDSLTPPEDPEPARNTATQLHRPAAISPVPQANHQFCSLDLRVDTSVWAFLGGLGGVFRQPRPTLECWIELGGRFARFPDPQPPVYGASVLRQLRQLALETSNRVLALRDSRTHGEHTGLLDNQDLEQEPSTSQSLPQQSMWLPLPGKVHMPAPELATWQFLGGMLAVSPRKSSKLSPDLTWWLHLGGRGAASMTVAAEMRFWLFLGGRVNASAAQPVPDLSAWQRLGGRYRLPSQRIDASLWEWLGGKTETGVSARHAMCTLIRHRRNRRVAILRSKSWHWSTIQNHDPWSVRRIGVACHTKQKIAYDFCNARCDVAAWKWLGGRTRCTQLSEIADMAVFAHLGGIIAPATQPQPDLDLWHFLGGRLSNFELEECSGSLFPLQHRGRCARSAACLDRHSTRHLQKLVSLLKEHPDYAPAWEYQGESNVWIVKAGDSSKGAGIRIRRDLDEILALSAQGRVVQKYVERPFLVEGFKFDLRVFALVTSFKPLVIYLYDSCYCRFASRVYDEQRLDDRIAHICNYSVQRRSMRKRGGPPVARRATSVVSNPASKSDNVWTLDQLLDHLDATFGATNGRQLWKQRVWLGIQRAVSVALASAAGDINQKAGCFELFGVDFVLDRTLRPWLLEVNMSPALNHRTTALAAMYADMMEQLLCVVVDKHVSRQESFNSSCNLEAFKWLGGRVRPAWRCIRSDAKLAKAAKVSRDPSLQLIVEGTKLTSHMWRWHRRAGTVERYCSAATVIQAAVRRWGAPPGDKRQPASESSPTAVQYSNALAAGTAHPA